MDISCILTVGRVSIGVFVGLCVCSHPDWGNKVTQIFRKVEKRENFTKTNICMSALFFARRKLVPL